MPLHHALEQLEQQLAENPNSAGLLAKNGDVFAMLGATNDAICEYEKALRVASQLFGDEDSKTAPLVAILAMLSQSTGNS